MGYDIRPLATLSAQARGFFTQSIPGALARVWANTFTVVGKVIALVQFENEQRFAWLFRQIFASTADDLWLTRHAFELGLSRLPASVAAGSITLAVVPGTVVPGGLTFTRGDGIAFVTIAGETAGGNSVTLDVEATAAGAAGNSATGETFTLDASDASANPALGTIATSTGGLGGGADIETLETFRQRVLARKRKPPQGGSAADYEEWAREALSTVRDVWVDSFQNDTRSVWLMFTVTDQPNGIPTGEQVAFVQAYINDPIRRPVTARAFASAPIPVPVDVAIVGLVPDTADTREAVEVELAATFSDRARPGTPSAPFRFYRSWIDEAISRATGEDAHDLTAPAGDPVLTAGRMPVLGAVTYADAPA